MGNPFPVSQVVRISQRVAASALRRVFPCRRMRRPRRVSRHLSRQPFGAPAAVRCPGSGYDIGSLLCHARDLAPRPVAICTPDNFVRPARCPRAAAQWPLWSRPPSRATARWRPVPLRRVDRTAARLRRGTFDTIRCLLTPDTLSGNAPVRRRVSAADCTMQSLILHQSRA